MIEEIKFVVEPYDLDIWQAKIANDRCKKQQKLFDTLLSSDEKLIKKGVCKGKINLLWLREPFFIYEASQGQSDTIVYKAEGKNICDCDGKEMKIEDYEWKSSNELLPIHTRFLLSHPYAYGNSPKELFYERRYILDGLSLEIYPEGKTSFEKINNWWREKYNREFMDEEVIYYLRGFLFKNQ